MLSLFFWWLLWFALFTTLAYYKTNNSTITLTLVLGFIATYLFSPFGGLSLFILLLFIVSIIGFLQCPDFRQAKITKPLLAWFKTRLPKMSETESIALQAGTVGFDGDLFSGNPRWSLWLKSQVPPLSKEEQSFLEGPVEKLCQMLNDWDITHIDKDLSKEVWTFLKQSGFFGIIIPKHYGGLEFSALAHSEILSKIASCSLTAASTVAVPNSLGPAELIHRYGTEQQKTHYLPRLAKGEDIPCFALTHRDAGSDATAIPDRGVICKDIFEGKEILGIRLNWSKRYITLAPIATLIGLAFKLQDPDHLLGENTDIGITCALVPAHLPGITIGNRHKPLSAPFQNGPITGKDVFIPLNFIIGGPLMAGQGWRMLVECLSTGRAISLPSSAAGASKMLLAQTSAYARIRKQFKQSIGKFGGVQEVLARMAANTYLIDAMRLITASCLDQKESPSVLGAISKCYATARFRQTAQDAMDIHGGKGIMLGPKNAVANSYMSAPISITVEGANILTRSMIIFGQGVMRSHPYILQEIEAARLPEDKALAAFDKAFLSHLGYSINNAARALVMGLSQWKLSDQYLSEMTRASSAFATVADVCMLFLGGKLKFKEKLSGRLSDMLAMMYIASCTLKRYVKEGKPLEDKPLVDWVIQDSLSFFWTQMEAVLNNFPNRFMGRLLRFFVMPFGNKIKKPSDVLTQKVATELLYPSQMRKRLIEGIYLDLNDTANPHCRMEAVFRAIVAAEEEGKERVQMEQIERAENLRKEVLEVDEFSPEEFKKI